MTFFTPLRCGASLVALIAAQTASADVTAQQVWDNWKSNIAIYGEDGVTIGTETAGNGTVTVSSLTLRMSDDDTTVTGEIGEIVFSENGDGTVSVTMPESFPMQITGPEGGAVVTVSNEGMDILASGTPEALSYQVSADRYSFVLDEFTGVDAPEGDFRVSLGGVAGIYSIELGAMRDITYALTTDTLDLLVDIKEPGSEEFALVSGQLTGFSANAVLALPLDADFEDSEALMAGGFSFEGSYGVDSGQFLFDIDAEGDQAQGTLRNGASDVAFLLNSERASYTAATSDLAMSFTVPDLPFPIDASLKTYGLNFAMPLASTETPEPFALGLTLEELALNDEIWAMGDPGAQLPRDPITFRLDLSGEGRLLYDLMDPAQADAMAMADMPGEIHALNLDDLTLEALGAEIFGAGNFTFDNSDLTTIPGVPRPEGQITVNINGANQLIDTLVAMGLIAEADVMMPRMMMGMFARTVGDDQLTSTIEVNEQGHVLANGQRIQ